MNRFILFLIFASAMLFVSADTMRNCFERMPDRFFPMLTHNNKLDLLDFADSGMKAVVKNIYGEQTQLLKLTDSYLCIRTSASSQTEMLLLAQPNDTLLCVVKTLYAPEGESEIHILHTATMGEATPLRKYIKVPVAQDFFTVPIGKTKRDLRQAISKMDVTMIAATIDAEDSSLHFTVNVDGGFTEKREEVAPFIKKEIVMKWDGRKFVAKR